MDKYSPEMDFEYSEETLLKYMKASVECKLEWLEELRLMTSQALTVKQKRIRKEIKEGNY